MKNLSKNIFANLFYSIFLLLFTMVGSINLLNKTYRKINDKIEVNAQTTISSPIPDEMITPTVTTTPTPTPTNTPIPTVTLTPTPVPPTAFPTNSPTPSPSSASSLSSPTQSVQSTSSNKPFDLTNWKLTLPIGEAKKPKEILQPELANFVIDPWFVLEQGAVRFRAAVNGATTGGSDYPRSELREMSDNGKNQASWSSKSGIHTLFIDQAITAVPQHKQHVVAGQIHDGGDDVIVIRLEMPNLYVNVDGKNKHTLDSGYTLGKRFTVKFEVSDGQTKIFYNGGSDPAYTLDKKYSEAYFKAGAYTQSNCGKEEPSPCTESNFGEVIIYQLSVNHQ
ncbi:polysaccharide lyase family 7 protein [Candidatus Roizmanbacteria bacterium]|nr:polysaccharide lyase family 7 protein [Candidatus Roizmanbacteria bacterium]